MSIYSARTGLSSILKAYSPAEREKAKNLAINKVRFELPKEQGVLGAVERVINHGDYMLYNEFVTFLKQSSLTDIDFTRVISEARRSIHLLTPSTFSLLVETLLALDWCGRNDDIIAEYMEFYVDLLVAHTKYVQYGISMLIKQWVPKDKDIESWPNGYPNDDVKKGLQTVHNILLRLLSVIPMTFDVVIEAVEESFPYYKKPSYVVGGYVFNMLWLLEYKPSFVNYMIQLLFKKLLILDANAPRTEIEDAEFEEDDMNENDTMFPIDDVEGKGADSKTTMNLPVAETLDICMELLFGYMEKIVNSPNSTNLMDVTAFFKILLNSFDDIILPSHNTHHVQFLLFYFCSFKAFLVEKFLSSLWNKVIDPNMSAPIRQSAVGYIASFLARSKFTSFGMLRGYLVEMCSWAHQYIQRSDSVRTSSSLKANIVFFSVCQAIFYVIAFRSRDLTHDKKSLLFLQSLQLSSLVTCAFNPLRFCIPPVATAFAGVTRAYQLAYCHTILERNARRKLATVYANETTLPQECLETFFPFDPYLLKKSGKRIHPIYLQYQASEAEEESTPQITEHNLRRKRTESMVSLGDDVDDFLVDKRQKLHDKDMQFTYGLSPGFHI